jgi:hypothetical protein
VIFSNEVCSTFTAMSSRTLLSDHVYFGIVLCRASQWRISSLVLSHASVGAALRWHAASVDRRSEQAWRCVYLVNESVSNTRQSGDLSVNVIYSDI